MSSKQIGDNEAQLMPIYLTSDIAIAHFFKTENEIETLLPSLFVRR